jgi:hypothetical protein
MAEQVIPDAGVYGAETAAATNAYNNAVAAATAQRNSLYHSYGLNQEGSVDPRNPGGQYQMMLHDQANQFQGDQESAAGRGLGRGGLANQAESNDRQGFIGQDQRFQDQVAGVGSDYNNALSSAFSNEQEAISQAQLDALNAALQAQISAMGSGDYTAPGTGLQWNPPPQAKIPKIPPKHPPKHPKPKPRKISGGRPFRAN